MHNPWNLNNNLDFKRDSPMKIGIPEISHCVNKYTCSTQSKKHPLIVSASQLRLTGNQILNTPIPKKYVAVQLVSCVDIQTKKMIIE